MGGWSWGEGPTTPEERLAAENALRQYDRLLELVEEHLETGLSRLILSPATIKELQRLAVEGLDERPGEFRIEDVEITGSQHDPPPWQEVPALVDKCCSYVTNKLKSANDELANALHVSAYALWRLNWIHPFGNGNGRTARAVSYLVMSANLGMILPGQTTIPERIARNRFPYTDALEAADRACKRGVTDITECERYLGKLLRAQLDGDD